jgi:hypothetical protein
VHVGSGPREVVLPRGEIDGETPSYRTADIGTRCVRIMRGAYKSAAFATLKRRCGSD